MTMNANIWNQKTGRLNWRPKAVKGNKVMHNITRKGHGRK